MTIKMHLNVCFMSLCALIRVPRATYIALIIYARRMMRRNDERSWTNWNCNTIRFCYRSFWDRHRAESERERESIDIELSMDRYLNRISTYTASKYLHKWPGLAVKCRAAKSTTTKKKNISMQITKQTSDICSIYYVVRLFQSATATASTSFYILLYVCIYFVVG